VTATAARGTPASRPSRRGRRLPPVPGITVALVGADGAGKSTVSRRLETAEGLPAGVRTIYMGVNLEASSLMLPTTRALLSAKRARGDDVETRRPAPDSQMEGVRKGRPVKAAVRLLLWAVEEWARQAAAAWYAGRGFIVIFDRHFFADFYFADPEPAGESALSKLHVWSLRHLYPKPGLTLCLDAPVDVLTARKDEDSPAFLAQRRQQYLDLETVVPAYRLIDAARPLDTVLDDVVAAIHAHWASTR
jgi:thymidylate kinase